MEYNKKAIWKNSMNYGAMLGVALVILSIVFYIFDANDKNWLSMILNYGVIIGGIVIGTKNLRDKEQNGYLTYGRGLGSGTLIALFSSVIVSLYMYVFFTYIDPDAINKMYAMMEESYMDQGLTDDQVEMAMDMAKKFTTPLMLSINTIFGFSFMGFLFSLITSIFLKKKPTDSFTFAEEIKENEE